MHVVHFVEQMHCTGVHTTILVYAVSTVHLMRVAGGGGGHFFSPASRVAREEAFARMIANSLPGSRWLRCIVLHRYT